MDIWRVTTKGASDRPGGVEVRTLNGSFRIKPGQSSIFLRFDPVGLEENAEFEVLKVEGIEAEMIPPAAILTPTISAADLIRHLRRRQVKLDAEPVEGGE